jgi:hypothetical protein
MKKDEEILKLKEELNYYKSNYSIQLPNFQKESTSFDACLKLKNKQSLKGNISINQDNTYKAFNSYTKSIFTTPNKKINQNKKINAIKYKYNLKKLVPIYVNKDLMLFPISNTKTVDNIYINSVNILEISKMENKTKIVFNNYDQIMVDKKYQLINNYYQRCLRIYNLI